MDIFGGDAYLNTRVSLFAKRLLDDEQIEQMPQLEPSEVARRYGFSTFQEQQGQGLSPVVWLRAIESAMLRSLFDDLIILIRPMDEPARECVLQWARKFELFNLKALIRGKLSNQSEADIQASLHDLPPFLALPYQSLMRTESVLEMLRLLESTGYNDIAGQARKVYEEHGEQFLLEAAIDQVYFSALVDWVGRLPLADRRDVRHMVGLQMDRVNLVLMLRYRFAYQLSPSEVYYQLVPSPGYLTKDRILALLDQETQEGMLAALPQPLTEELQGAEDIATVERRMYALYSYELRRILACSTSGVARTLAYLALRELDMKRVFSVVQGQLLKIDGALIDLALGIQPGLAPSRRRPHYPNCDEA